MHDIVLAILGDFLHSEYVEVYIECIMCVTTLFSVDGPTPTSGGSDSTSTQSDSDTDNNLGTGDDRPSNTGIPDVVSGNNVGAIAGGVAGALLAVMALLVLIVVVILVIFIVRWRNQRLKETDNQGMLL